MIGVLKNEALGLIAIQAVLSELGSLSIAKSYLIIPLALDKNIASYLKRKSTNILSTQELITSKSEYFIGFDNKFTDSSVTTTNAIAMGLELHAFSMSGKMLRKIEPPHRSQDDISPQIDDLMRTSKKVAAILSDPAESVFSLLRIEL